MNQARHSVPGFLLRRNSGDFRASRPHAVGRHQGEQFVRRWRVERIGDDDPLFTLGRDLQNGRQLPRIPCQQDRLQMFIGFQQVIARVTALTQGAEVAPGTTTASTVSDGEPAKVPAIGSGEPSSAMTSPIRE